MGLKFLFPSAPCADDACVLAIKHACMLVLRMYVDTRIRMYMLSDLHTCMFFIRM